MTVQHIGMVYAAGGLEANEKHLLGAYCNHTDAHGYCWPGVERLADETGMSARTVKRVNAALRAKQLIRSVHRTNPKTGEQITNLTRVNLPLLESMRRADRAYDDNLIDAITFDEVNPNGETFSQVGPGCQSVTPGGDNLTPPRCQSVTPRGDNLTPKTSVETSVETFLLLPSDEPTPPESQPGGRNEEEGEAESGDNPNPARTAEVIAWVEALPWRRHPGRQQREHLARLVEGAQAAGWSLNALHRELTMELGSAKSLYAVWDSRLKELPAPPLAPVIPLTRSADPSCAQHPGAGRRGEQCAGCWSERYG